VIVRAPEHSRAAGPKTWLLGLALAAVAAGFPVAFGATAGAAAPEAVAITSSSCVPHWSVPNSGLASYAITSSASTAADVELLNHQTGAVVGSIVILGPKTTRPLAVRLAKGSYNFQCIYDHRRFTYRSPVLSVHAGVPAAKATPSNLPTTVLEMASAVSAYDTYVADQIQTLQNQVNTLQSDVAQNNLAQAKTDWLSAELTYSGIGGTYGAFGGLEDQINGLPNGLPQGVNDPNFVGLHKVEYQLWSGQPASAIAPSVTNLVNTLNLLHSFWFTGRRVSANLLSTRAHEILEDTQRDTLSGNDNEGSDSSLARAWADLQGENVVLGYLRGVLNTHNPKILAAVTPELAAFGQALQSTKVNGQWVPLASITTAQREQIDATLGQTLETLSMIPDTLEIQAFADGEVP
jgi:high-affinity iron transporter